jgi:fucose permease
MYFAPLPEVKAEGEDETDADASTSITGNKTSILQFPHLLLGVLTIFIYVGVETLPMASMIDFAKSVFPSGVDLTGFTKFVPIGMMAGYVFGVLMIPKILSQTRALKLVSIIGILAALAVIFVPGNYGIYCLALIGFANSLMWPAIWPLAIADLGKFTKTGASLLVMGIVGGAIIPLIFGLLVDMFKGGGQVVTATYQSAYWIFIPCYLFILYFAIAGHKIRK